MKTYSAEKYHDQTMKFTHSTVGLTPFRRELNFSHYTLAVRNLILRYLTGSHITILSNLNYRVRLNVNTDIAESISSISILGKPITLFLG